MKVNDFNTKLKYFHADKLFIDEPVFKKSSILIPLITIDGCYHVVFERRSPYITQANEICFPGGKHDMQDHTYLDTAIRETCEELGIVKQQIKVLTTLNTMIHPSGIIVYAYLGELLVSLDVLRLNKQEVDEVFTLPLSYFIENQPLDYYITYKAHPYIESGMSREYTFPAANLGLPEKYHEPWGEYQSKVYMYETDFGMIWGITAKILHDFVCSLNEN